MNLIYAAKLGLANRKTNVDAQKIYGSTLVAYKMVLIGFSVQDKLERVWFFEKTFFLTNTSIEVVLRMPFLAFSNADVEFTKQEKLT